MKYTPTPELTVVEGEPQGKVTQFTMHAKDSRFFNLGIAREVFGTVDPRNPKALIGDAYPIDYQRTITVYVPAQYVARSSISSGRSIRRRPAGAWDFHTTAR